MIQIGLFVDSQWKSKHVVPMDTRGECRTLCIRGYKMVNSFFLEAHAAFVGKGSGYKSRLTGAMFALHS